MNLKPSKNTPSIIFQTIFEIYCIPKTTTAKGSFHFAIKIGSGLSETCSCHSTQKVLSASCHQGMSVWGLTLLVIVVVYYITWVFFDTKRASYKLYGFLLFFAAKAMWFLCGAVALWILNFMSLWSILIRPLLWSQHQVRRINSQVANFLRVLRLKMAWKVGLQLWKRISHIWMCYFQMCNSNRLYILDN